MDLLVNELTPALCSTRPTPSLCLVQSVVCSLFSVQSYPWTLVRSAAADIDSRSQCADASRSVPVRAVRVRRVHGSSWPRKSVLCQCAHAFLNFCAQLCACVLEFLCPVVRMLTLQVCACVFHQFRTTHRGWLVCRVRHCVSDRLKEGCFRSSFASCLFVDSWLLDFSACQMRCPDLLNLLTRWSWFCPRLIQEFLIGVCQELCMKEVWKSWFEIGKTVEKCK